MRKFAMVIMAAAFMSVPAFAAENEEAATEGIVMEESTEAEEAQMLHGKMESQIENGVLTIRIEATDHDDENMHWTAFDGDRVEAPLTELLTETDMEDGYAYVGSFRALPEAEDGEDYICLAYTDGNYVSEYVDWKVSVKDGKIEEVTGGGQAFRTSCSTMAPFFEGVWEEEDGSGVVEVALDEENDAFKFTVSFGDGKDGQTTFYTMNGHYDAIEEAFVYWDGEEHTAAITDCSEEAVTEAEEMPEESKGKGSFKFVLNEDDSFAIVWEDDTFGHTETGKFIKAA